MSSTIWTILVLRGALAQDTRSRLTEYVANLACHLYQPMEHLLVERGRGAKRRKEVEARPLLGNYALARLPADNPPFAALMEPMAKMCGIFDFVRTGTGMPAEIPERVVDHLRGRDEKGEFVRYKRHRGRLRGELPKWLCVGGMAVVRDSHKSLGGMVFSIGEIDETRGRVGLLMPGHTQVTLPLYVYTEDLRGCS